MTAKAAQDDGWTAGTGTCTVQSSQIMVEKIT